MTILAVDNNIQQLNQLEDYLRQRYDDADVHGFCDPLLAIKYCLANKIDIVYAAVSMRGMDGFSLLNGVKHFHPDVQVALLADSNDYCVQAEEYGVIEYIIKPINRVS